jgi:hypothetical protein
VHRQDVRVLELGSELDLALEPDGADGARALGREDLDDNRTAKRPIGCEEEAAHSTTAQLAL